MTTIHSRVPRQSSGSRHHHRSSRNTLEGSNNMLGSSTSAGFKLVSEPTTPTQTFAPASSSSSSRKVTAAGMPRSATSPISSSGEHIVPQLPYYAAPSPTISDHGVVAIPTVASFPQHIEGSVYTDPLRQQASTFKISTYERLALDAAAERVRCNPQFSHEFLLLLESTSDHNPYFDATTYVSQTFPAP